MRRIHDFKGWELHLEELNRSRRKFLKSLGKTAAISAISTATLKTIFNWIRNSYGEEASESRDAFELRFSDEGERFLRHHYEEEVPDFENELMIAKAEVLNTFKDWSNEGVNCIMNQKMYDALVMICFRIGKHTFSDSKFLAAIKKSNYSEAVTLLKKNDMQTLWNCSNIEFVQQYEVTLLSSFDSDLQDVDIEEVEEPSQTAGVTGDSDSGLIQLRKTNYKNVKYDLDKTQYDKVNKKLLDDLQEAAEKAGVVVTITTARSGHSIFTILGTESRHRRNNAVDIAILNGIGSGGATNAINGNPKFRELGNKLKDELVDLGYVWNTESKMDKAVLWHTNKGGNHFNHLHVSRKSR